MAKIVKSVEVEYADGKKEYINPNKRSRLSRREKMGLVFIIPYVIAFCIFSVYPVFQTLWLSFQKVEVKIISGTTYEFIGIDNYITILKDKFFWQSFVNTLKIWGLNIVLQLGLAFLLTIIFVDIKYKIKGIMVYRAVYYLPNIIAITSISFLFSTLLDEHYGTVNKMISAVIGHGFVFDWLGNSDSCWIVIAIIQTWIWFGNSFIMLMAGVMGINTDYYEAASIDGAGRWKQFTKITLPLLKPIMLYVGVTSLIGGIQMFDLPYVMIGPKGDASASVKTAIWYLYERAFGNYSDSGKAMSRAAATAYILFAIILVVSVLQFILMRDKDKED